MRKMLKLIRKEKKAMNMELKSKFAFSALFVMVLAFLASPVQAGTGIPRVVSLTGILYPPGQRELVSVHALTVYVQGKECVFDLKKVENLRAGSTTGWEILHEIFPSILRFWGPSKYISPLEKPEIIGKSITIRGFLYVDTGIFYITEIKNVA